VIALDYAAPPPDLAEFISAFYHFEADDIEFNELERADVAQFRFVLAGDGYLEFPDGDRFPFARCSLLGPRTVASRVVATGPIHVFGAGLLPPGWAALTGMEASLLTNRMMDATELLGPGIEEVYRTLQAANGLDELTKIGVIFARSLKQRASEVPIWFTRAVDRWLVASLNPQLSDLMQETGLTRRQIEKLTKQLYGATPSLLIRKYRALRTASAVARGDGTWQEFAADAYYDQSHCIREVKEFTGITPRGIQDEEGRLSRLTFGRAALTGKISSLSSDS
jgi:AraC-like DNA-binding protein